jgi:Rrf2 family protein
MRLSMKTDYALRAIFTLVEYHGQQPIPIRELARRNEIPKRFLEQILLQMKEKGWVDSMPGKVGGYRLARDPEKITMGEIVRHFEEVLAPIHCVSVAGYRRCSQEPVCRFRRLMLNVRHVVATMMDGTTLAAVYKGLPVTNEEVFAERLLEGAGI